QRTPPSTATCSPTWCPGGATCTWKMVCTERSVQHCNNAIFCTPGCSNCEPRPGCRQCRPVVRYGSAVSSIDAKRAHDARETRRRHLQQRQTVIFGSLIAGLLVIGLAAGAIWAGILPAPVSIPIQSPEPEEVAAAPPCPPEDALPVPLGEISADVLNGTNRSGLAAGTSASLAERGVVIGDEANAPVRFEGVVRIVTGPTAVAEAYTVAAQFPEAL